MSRWALSIATLGPIGYLKAPGSIATCATLPFIYWLQQVCTDQPIYVIIAVCSIIVAYAAIRNAIRDPRIKDHDPSEIVLDEVIGCMLTFTGIPMTIATTLLGVIIFRIFDITKWGLIGRAERIPGAGGILADDIVAGLFANILLRFLF